MSMSRDHGDGCGIGLMLAAIAAVAFLIIGLTRGEHLMKEEAIEAGHAEYYLDENNERQWRWKECE